MAKNEEEDWLRNIKPFYDVRKEQSICDAE